METDKEKLTLKELAGYLPYGLKAYCNEDIQDVTLEDEMDGYSICVRDVLENNHKLVLRPLSDLTNSITHNGETFVPIDKLNEKYSIDIDENGVCYNGVDEFGIFHLPYSVIKKIYEWKFDIHGGIGTWAIDLNTIENGK